MNNRIIIIGGMGPQASLDLHHRIIQGASLRGAKNGEDFPEIIHLSVPVPDFISGNGLEKAALVLKKALGQVYLWQYRSNYNCV
jgi:aspartate/glutamate racemase